jgi:hypothetical protein
MTQKDICLSPVIHSRFHLQKFPLRIYGLALVLILSYSFLAYKLFTFNNYAELAGEWNKIPLSQFSWLLLVFILLPVNWLLEAKKWQISLSKIEKTSLHHATKAVLSGIFTGFFTPNRVGELAGRVVFLKKENRKPGVSACVMNSITQNIIIVMCGIPASIFFFLSTTGSIYPDIMIYVGFLIIGLLLVAILYFSLSRISLLLSANKYTNMLKSFFGFLADYTTSDFLKITLVTLLRYTVFCSQFYFMLLFFGVDVEFWQALIAIPTTYLFVTFTPSLALSEAAVRSSYSVLVIGAFSSTEITVILAGVGIWLVNFAIPMLVGSVIMLRIKK